MKKAVPFIMFVFLTASVISVFLNRNSPAYLRAELVPQGITSSNPEKYTPSFSAVQKSVSFKLLLHENISSKKMSVIKKASAQGKEKATTWTDGTTDITASLFYGGSKTKSGDFSLKLEKEAEDTLSVNLERSDEKFTPGTYNLEVKLSNNGKERIIKSEFTWGVLAINVNKSILKPGETAYLQMGVLDKIGHTMCNAELRLEIKGPSGAVQNFDTSGNSINRSSTCGKDNVTDNPDYFLYYKVGSEGTYQMKLKNVSNGYEITDAFEVRKPGVFEVERVGATRINPFKAAYTMRLKVKANEDFEGRIVETVNGGFDINCTTSVIKCKVGALNNGTKKVTWDEVLLKDKSISLEYTYQAPKISPALFLTGPLSIFRQQAESETIEPVFTEARKWQIASDAIGYVQEVAVYAGGATTTITFNVTAETTQGNHLMLVAGNTGAFVVSTVTDTQNNTWQVDESIANGSVASSSIASTYLTTALSQAAGDQITVTISGAGTIRGVLVEEFSGLDPTSWFDVSANNTAAAPGSTSISTGTTGTTSQARELVIMDTTIQADGRTFTKDAAFSSFTTTTTGRIGGAYRIVSTAGTQTSGGSWSGAGQAYSAAIATYRAAPPTKVVFTNSERTLTAGHCNDSAKVFTMQLQDGSGTATEPTATTVVRVDSSSGNYKIYSDSTCQTEVTNREFTYTDADHTKSIYIKDWKKSTGARILSGVRVSGNTLTTGNQSYNVNAGAVAGLYITLPDQLFIDNTGNTGDVKVEVLGVYFAIRIAAVDSFNNVNTSYTGSKTLVFSGPGAGTEGTSTINGNNIGDNSTVAFSSGLTGILARLYKTETTTITATDGGLYASTSASLTIGGVKTRILEGVNIYEGVGL